MSYKKYILTIYLLISGSGIKKYTNFFLVRIFTNVKVGIIRSGIFTNARVWIIHGGIFTNARVGIIRGGI